MSSQPVHHHDGPLIPMPELNLPSLRRAVATVAPSRLPEMIDEMQEAFDAAGKDGRIGAIRLFYRRWGIVVAIERDPERSARFHAAMRTFHTATGDEQQAAVMEIADILHTAECEVEALESAG